MTNNRLKEIEKDKAGNEILNFIPNNLGINLCSVNDIIINRQGENGEGKLLDIKIDFISN